MQQKRIFLLLYLKTKLAPKMFLKFSTEKVLCALGHIFNKFNRSIVEKPGAAGELDR